MVKGFQINISNTCESKNYFSDEYDSFAVINQEVEIALEGVILNKRNILKDSFHTNFSHYFTNQFLKKNINAIGELDGEFRGYIWDKLNNKVFVFTNSTSTQRVFYTKINENIYVDSHLVRLSRTLKHNHITISPNIDNIYKLLTFGNMLENETPIDHVFKILDGHYLEIDLTSQTIQEKKYFDLGNVPYFKGSKKNAIRILDELFLENIINDYEKDLELGSKHFNLLSGGLDSRMTLFYARKLGYKIDKTFCFSQSNYLDDIVSRKIANDYGISHCFQSLDGGSYLKYIDLLTELSEGCSLFTGGIHVQFAFENIKKLDFKIVHSGSIGDGILGGFNSASHRKKPNDFKIVINSKFLPKVKSYFEETINRYESEELFYLRNIAFNRTVLGAQVIQQYAYQTSPFMSKKILEFAISLPENWKLNQRFYLEWMSSCMPNACYYIWEKTGMKPNALWKNTFGVQVKKRVYNYWVQNILGKHEKTSMYPYEFYYNSSLEIQTYYNMYFEENISRLDHYPELKKDVIDLFQQKDYFQKSQGINILAIFKLFF